MVASVYQSRIGWGPLVFAFSKSMWIAAQYDVVSTMVQELAT